MGSVNLTDFAIAIVVLGIVVTIGSVVLSGMKVAQITNAATYAVKGESVTPTQTGTALSTGWGKSIDFCRNSTSGPTIGSPNYTYSVNEDTGVISIKNLTGEFRDSAWTCNYTVYNKSDVRFHTADQAQLGLAEYGNWFKIIVIVGVAAVILTLIFMAFGRGAGSVGGSSQGY